MPVAGDPPRVEAHIRRKLQRRPSGAVVEVLRDVHLAVARGEFVCLLGPSGCGKTTALRILCGLDTDFEGQVARTPGVMGLMFQEPRLLPWRTVAENIRLVLPKARRREDLAPLLRDLGLADHAGLYPHALSLGLARRVALARALAVWPDWLVLDEPFVSLDARAAGVLRQLVLRAAAGGASVLMVTHNVQEALQLADGLVLLGDQPTQVVGEVRLDAPRAARSTAWISAQTAALRARFPMLEDGAAPAEASELASGLWVADSS